MFICVYKCMGVFSIACNYVFVALINPKPTLNMYCMLL